MADIHNVTVVKAGTAPVGTVIFPVFFAPTDALGGGITVTRVTYISPLAVAAASAAQPTLITLGTDSAVNGTIATALASAAWTAGTVREGSVATAFVDATYAVAVRWAQTAANADENNYICNVQYVMGK